MKTNVLFLFLIIQIACVNQGFTQKYNNEGTDFWFAYPKIASNAIYNLAITNNTFEVHITSRDTTSGTITIDEHFFAPSPPFSVAFQTIPGEVTTVVLPSINVHNPHWQFIIAGINLHSVHVTSECPVAVFAAKVKNYQPTISSVMPTHSLGSNYFVTTKPSFPGGVSGGFTSECGVVAVVAPGTPVTVKVTSPIDILHSSPGLSNIMTANIPDTVNIVARGVLQIMTLTQNQDITGLKIEALNGTDVFAVYSGHSLNKMWGHTADPMFELEYPTSTWGDQYIISPAPNALISNYRVVSMSDGTEISVDGVYDTTLNEGEFYEDTISLTTVIEGSNPIKVTYFMPNRIDYGIPTYNPGDNSMINIVPNSKMYMDMASFFRFEADLMDTSFVKVITRTVDINTVALNGVTLTSWDPVGFLPEYSYCLVGIEAGESKLTTTGEGFIAYVHGVGNYESYNYAIGAFLQEAGTDTQAACDSYTWVDGITYTENNNTATYTYINGAANGCDSLVILDLTINNSPSFTITGTDPSSCNTIDGFITFTGLNAATTYPFSYDSLGVPSQTMTITTDATGQYVLSGLAAGIYSSFSLEQNSCQFTSTVIMDLINPEPPVMDVLSDTTICDSYTLVDITGTNLSGNESYYTQAIASGTPLSPGDVITSTQTIYLYDVLGLCSDESSFTITINNTPLIDNPGPQQVCESYFLPLSITGTSLSGNENYYTDLQSNGGTIITGNLTTTQTVYIYDANGSCSDETSFEVTIHDVPSLISFSGGGTYCEGDAIASIMAEVSGMADYTLNYTLDGVPLSVTSSNSTIDMGNTSGVYILTVVSDNFCSATLTETQTITINPLPNTPDVSEDQSYCANAQPLDMQASGSTGTYTWYSDAELTQILGISGAYTPDVNVGSTTYYVTATENGCEGNPEAIVILFEDCSIIIPTAFTPDYDQVNDTWKLENIDNIYPNNMVSVYNRFGNKVYESKEGSYNAMPWNGTHQGEELPVASYYYIIEYNDNSTKNITGIVSIIK